ncbi:MAG: sigma-70 family RNA polymerase sigma factor [Opitutaceae bacterium]|nr:sigma-70 family RNA polymerase sigma factor [Opitutaceae bacterium]
MPPADPATAAWFATHVQPHEPALRAWLHARFPAVPDHDDIVQDAFTRVLRQHERGEVQSAKALLFTAARNLALDALRRRGVTPTIAITDFGESCVLEATPDAATTLNHQQELAILTEAVRALPDRCRQVVMLRHLEGLSYKEIAAQLGISPETVKVQLVKGLRRCAAHFAARGLLREPPPGIKESSA